MEYDEIQAVVGFHWKFSNVPVGSTAMKKAIFRAKKVLAGLVHDMTALEDNPFTFPEVQTLLDGITVGGHKVSDEQQVLNTASAWKRLFELVETGRFELSKEVFCELHAHVAQGEALTVGEFRDGMVGIGGTEYRPPAAGELDGLFAAGLNAIKVIENVHERAFVFFLFGALNQFFWDGNKRTSRLILSGELLRHGHDIVNIPAKRKLEFNQKMLRFYDSKDASEMMAFLFECILD